MQALLPTADGSRCGRPVARLTTLMLVVSSVSWASGAQEQRPSFGADVSVVRIDVIATDEEGRFVDDLGIDEFVLYEDGVRQALSQAQLVDLRVGGGTADQVGGDAVSTGRRDTGAGAGGRGAVAGVSDPAGVVVASDVSGARAAQGAVARSPELGAMVFFVEPSRLGFWAQRRFIEAWMALVDATEGYGAPKAIYLLDYFGRLHEIMPLTTDPEAMVRAGEELEQRMTRLGNDELSLLPEEMQVAAAIEQRSGTLRTLEVLEALAASFSFRRGRKSIVWVSTGVPTTAGYMIVPEMVDRLKEVLRTANTANTSIYAVDPTLVNERYRRRRSSDVRERIGPADEFLADPWDSRVARYNALRDSLLVAAEDTGGRAYEFTTRVADALDEIRTDVERYYLLAYPDRGDGDGTYREIRVETTRPGVKVRARAGYTDYSTEQLARLRASADLAFPEFSATAALDFAVYRSWADDGSPRLQVAMALEPGAAEKGSTAGVTAERSFQLALSAVDDSGRVVDTRHEVVQWGAADPSSRPAVYVHDWPLGYGSFELRVALVDRDSLQAAAGSVALEFRRPSGEVGGDHDDRDDRDHGWRVTDPILLGRSPSGIPEPIIGDAMQGAAPVGVYFECWDEEPSVAASLFTRVGQSSLPVDVQQMAGVRGRFRVFVSLSEAMPRPGHVVRIDIGNPVTGERRSFEIEVGRRPR